MKAEVRRQIGNAQLARLTRDRGGQGGAHGRAICLEICARGRELIGLVAEVIERISETRRSSVAAEPFLRVRCQPCDLIPIAYGKLGKGQRIERVRVPWIERE